ncbi:helix-turn-helix transcriptional regulator [bacterium]|nr:helix-turn-helix transcriptional regulator [bacterium]
MENDIKVLLGQKIKEYRKKKGLTQEQLAEAVGLDTVTVSKIETGRNYPTSVNLANIANTLCVQPRELYDFSFGKNSSDILSEVLEKVNKISTNDKKLHLLYSIVSAIE